MVKLELASMDWFFYNLVILIKLYKNWILKFRQSSEKPGYLPKNWKLWRAQTTTKFNIFCWNFAHVSHLKMSTKGCLRFSLLCLDLVYIVYIVWIFRFV